MESTELPQNFLQHEEGDEVVEAYEINEDGVDQEEVYDEWVVDEETAPDGGNIIIAEEGSKNYGQFPDEEHVYMEAEDHEGDVQFYDEQHYDEEYEGQQPEDVVYEDEHSEGNEYHHEMRFEDIPLVEISRFRRDATIAECEYCGQLLKHPSKIKAHMRTHTGEKPFECTMCGMKFTQKVPMLNHMRRHLNDLPHQCSFCDKRFVNNAQKNAHELRHQGMKRRGPPRPHLKPPKRVVHDLSTIVPKPQPTTAPELYAKAPLSAAAQKRIEEVINAVAAGKPVKKKPQLVNRSSLIAQCNVCGLMLRHASKIQEHMRIHTGEKPFGCAVCGLRFARTYSLKMHMKRKHSDAAERKITCSYDCGLHFVSIGERNEHERSVHSGVKRYSCTVPDCGKMFTRRMYLMTHRMKEHPAIHQPLFNPHEVTAEEELDHHSGHEQEESEMLVETDMERLIELPDGMLILPDGAHILEGEFVDEEEAEDVEQYEHFEGETTPGPSHCVQQIKVEPIPEENSLEEEEEDKKGGLQHIWMAPEEEGLKRRVAVRIVKER